MMGTLYLIHWIAFCCPVFYDAAAVLSGIKPHRYRASAPSAFL